MIHELVLFRFRPDAAPAARERAMASLDDFLRRAPGFVERHTLHDAGRDTWIDLVAWRTLDDATAASAAFEASEHGPAFLAVAEPESLQMYHATTARRLAVA